MKELALGALVAATLSKLPDVTRYPKRHLYNAEIRVSADRNNVNYHILKGLIATESAFRVDVKNPQSSATGLTQVIRATASEVGIPHEYLALENHPEYEIEAGARYLAKMQREFGIYGGIRAYYSGPATYRDPSRNPKHSRESIAYANKVMAHAVAFYLEDFGL